MQPCSIPNFLLTDKADITNSSHIKTSNFHMAQLSGPYNDEAIKLLFYFQSLSDMQSLLLIKMVKHLLQSYYFDFSFQQYYITFKSVKCTTPTLEMNERMSSKSCILWSWSHKVSNISRMLVIRYTFPESLVWSKHTESHNHLSSTFWTQIFGAS